MLEDVTLRNSPAWTVHPVDCDRLTIRGISIVNGLRPDDHGPHTIRSAERAATLTQQLAVQSISNIYRDSQFRTDGLNAFP
jgi:hypothetical protein